MPDIPSPSSLLLKTNSKEFSHHKHRNPRKICSDLEKRKFKSAWKISLISRKEENTIGIRKNEIELL